MEGLLKSCICNQQQLESPAFQLWSTRMREEKICLLHRKNWEWCFIAQALFERDMLKPGRRGIGFAVGREPLPALFASLGCTILATDLDEERAGNPAANWVDTGQHAANVEVLNERGICDPVLFKQNVSFRVVDMNEMPEELRGFDFCWSSCAFEHLGSLDQGKQFIYNMLSCLNPGGVAVHTTEYNVTSNENTIDYAPVTLFRRCDIEEMVRELRNRGCSLEVDFTLGEGWADLLVDHPPYKENPHLKLLFGPYVITSISLIIQKGGTE